jgi:hypothetical protein
MTSYPPTPDRASALNVCSSRRKVSTEIRMNVADAITAIDSALRAGRMVALRRPRLATARQPRPARRPAGARPQ